MYCIYIVIKVSLGYLKLMVEVLSPTPYRLGIYMANNQLCFVCRRKAYIKKHSGHWYCKWCAINKGRTEDILKKPTEVKIPQFEKDHLVSKTIKVVDKYIRSRPPKQYDDYKWMMTKAWIHNVDGEKLGIFRKEDGFVIRNNGDEHKSDYHLEINEFDAFIKKAVVARGYTIRKRGKKGGVLVYIP